VLSKSTQTVGREAFQRFFERIVWQCVEAGLVDGSKIFMDSSLVMLMPPTNSVVNVNKETLKSISSEVLMNSNHDWKKRTLKRFMNRNQATWLIATTISTTDPDASVTSQGAGKRTSI